MKKLSLLFSYFLILLITGNDGRIIFNPRSKNGVVVSNGPGCAQIGRNIMQKGGNVIDTVIATAFCEGVVNPSTMGIGGGFLATFYHKKTGEVFSFNARESAPALAKEDMFNKNPSLSGSGGLSVAIPSEVRGYWHLYKKWGGGVPWRYLVEPTIKLCKEGIPMNELTEKNAKNQIEAIRADPGLRAIFIDPDTDNIYKYGQLYKRPKLAHTLRIIAKEGGDALNGGSLTKALAKDIQEKGGIVTAKDLISYKPEIMKPVHAQIGDKDIFSIPVPGSGAILTYILDILENSLDTSKHLSTLNYQRLAEALKFAYGQRSRLGDSGFVEGVHELVDKLISKKYAEETRFKISDNKTFDDPDYYGSYTESKEDHGTANICVWGPDGDGISLTSSINFIFGAAFASKSTDIILNNSMDDFSSPGITNVYGYPPSPANFIKPGKRPLSSMSPSIILDKDKELFMVVGGAGGSKIISSVAQVIINRLFFNMDVRSASNLKRIHHQLIPMTLYMEDEWLIEDEDIVLDLQKIGHNVTFTAADGFVAVTAISVDDVRSSELIGVHDKRRLGSVAYLK